jgi:drug/metabolite transporter (DMT)-like permease
MSVNVASTSVGGVALCVVTSISNAASDILRKKVMLTRNISGIETIAYRGLLQLPIYLILMYVDRFIDEFYHFRSLFDPTQIHPYYHYALICSGFINMLTSFLYFTALRYAPLSLSVPYLSLTPAFLLLTSWFFVDEVPTTITCVGVALVALGGLLLGRSPDGRSVSPVKESTLSTDMIIQEKPIREKKEYIGSLLMIAISILWSISAVLDKIGVSSMRHKADYGIIIHTIMTIPILVYCLVFVSPNRFLLEHGAVPKDIENKNRLSISEKLRIYYLSSKPLTTLLFFNALTNSLAYWFQLEAIKFIHVSYVISVKRAGVLLTILLGRYYFAHEEKNVLWRMSSASIMVAGVLLIVLSGHIYS